MTSGMRGRVAILVFPEKADYLAKIEDLIGTYPTVDCKKHMRRDPAKFIDFKRSTMWLAKEHVFVDHR